MADSALKTVNWVGNVLVEEGKYLWGAKDKVDELQNELLWMQRDLEKAESLKNKGEVIHRLVLQMKEYVSEAEDIVDQFVLDVVWRRMQTGWARRLERWARIGEELWALHQVASSVDSLTLKVSKLQLKLKACGVDPAYALTQEAASSEGIEWQSLSYARLEGKKPVGLVEDTETIVTALLEGSDQQRRVVAMYGMVGVGKTTLALKVYDQHRIKQHFKHRAWAYISKQFQIQNVLQTLLADLTSKPTYMYSGKKFDTLQNELREVLRKSTCLVVLDDVWETKVWDDLKSIFPRDGGSKVLFTTRKEDVAKHADPSALAKPDRLNNDDSWKLLKQSLGWVDEGESHGNEEHNSGFRLGPKMFGPEASDQVEQLGKEMAKNCNGVPLAIVVLGGILRKKESLEGWRLTSENINSYLRSGKDPWKSYMKVLALSYTDLPYHLKPCFLHLANFPEDYEIHAEKLYRMWVAEGLIAWPYERLSNTETLEDIADEYLYSLAQAGMVQIVNKASNGRIKSVRIHDLMRDVCLQRAVTENFFTAIDHRACPDEPQSLSSSMNHARLLHMAIYLAENVSNYLPDFLTSKAHRYLRSLLLFSGQEIRAGEQVINWMKSICKDFPWLRVLDIEGLRLKGRLTKDIQNMKYLRYLSLKGTDISDVPSSIGDLMFLRTLDLRVSFYGLPVKIPNTLRKLERLRHLFLPKKSYQIKKSKFLCLHTLTCLEVLKNLEAGMLKAEDLLKIRKLKKLSMKGFVEEVESIRIIVNSPAAKTGHLRSCSLCVKGAVLDANPGILSRFDCLHLLKVMDKFSCLKETVLPQCLAELHLESCQLEKDPMAILGSLNHLRHLSLGHNSFVGKKMTCELLSFPQLLQLNLQGLENLEKWTLAERALINLNKLIIMDCRRLINIPVRLPQSVQVTCSPCIPGIEKYGTCNYYGATFIDIDIDCRKIFGRDYDVERLVEILLINKRNKVVLLGPAGVGKSTVAKSVSRQPNIREKFNTITWIRFPHHLNIEDMMQPKCLLILAGSATLSRRDVDKILGARIPEDSKILLLCDEKLHIEERNSVYLHLLDPLSLKNSNMLLSGIVGLPDKVYREWWKMQRRALAYCSGLPLSIILLGGALRKKKSQTEWKIFYDNVFRAGYSSGCDPKVFLLLLAELCYEDLPPHLQDCFVYLAMFPENFEISARKLQHMWIAAGFVSFRDDGKSKKKSKEGNGQVEKLLENVAATSLKELVARGMVEVEKRSLDGRISTCRLHLSLRSMCLQKAKEKGLIMRAEVKSSKERGSTGRSDKRWLKLPRQCLCLGEQREEQLEEQREEQLEEQLEEQRKEHVPTNDQPTMSAPRLNEMEHLAVCVGRSDREILDDPASVGDQLRSLLFFPEASGTIKWAFSWQCFQTICNHFTHLLVLDLEGMRMMTGTLPEDVGNLRKLKYLSLKGTRVSGLPSTIQQLSHLQTLDLRVITSLTILGDSFRFHQLRHLYLPESFSVTTSLKLQAMSSSSKLQLSGSDHLQILANLQTDKVDLNCVSDLNILRRVSVNHIHAKDELDRVLKSRGTAIDLIIKSEILYSDIVLSSFQNLRNMTIKGKITAPLSESMLPKGLKELKLKHTELADDPNPILRDLPELTHLTFDHDSFLGKRMVISSGFVQLSHLTLRLLDKLEDLDMTEAVHLRHVEPVTIECWRIEVKYPRADAGIDRQEPSLNADGNDAEESEIDSDEMTEEEETSEQMETDVETSKPIGDPNSECPSASYTIHAAEITEEEEAVEQMSSGMHTNSVGPSKLIGNRDFESVDNVHATEITEEEGAIANTHVAEITEEEEGNEQM